MKPKLQTPQAFGLLRLLFAVACICLAFLSLPLVQEAVADTAPVLPATGYTQNVATGVTLTASMVSTQNVVIDVTGKANLAVQFQQTGAAASATNPVTYTFQQSLDNANWVAWKTATITSTGTTAVNVLSNTWTLGGVRYIRLSTVDNAAAGSTPTNTFSVKAATN